MRALADGEINQDVKDRFAMEAAIADRHWKVVARYLPEHQQNDSPGVLSQILADMEGTTGLPEPAEWD